jgi:hypothetical protein
MEIEKLIRDEESLRLLLRTLIFNFGTDVENKVIGHDKKTKEAIVMNGRQIRLSLDTLMGTTMNMALGLDYDKEKDEIILFVGLTEEDKDGIRYDN